MNCSETKSKLGFYLDQTLADGEMQDLRRHICACASCSIELQNLQKIESVIQSGLYTRPTDEYWRELPPRITRRIGIRPDTSNFDQLIESIQGLFAAPSFRWAFAGAFAVTALLFFFNKIIGPEQASVNIAQNAPPKNEPVPRTSVAELKEAPNSVGDSRQELASGGKENREAEELVSEPMANILKPKEDSEEIAEKHLTADLLALTRVSSKPLRTEYMANRSINQELYPIPNTEFILPPQSDDLQNGNNSMLRTFALDKQNARSSQADAVSELPDEIKRIRSGFLETLWIVQESHALDEKKNIWLSYINRESDITYRSLGIYNLALVLTKIAEESKNLDHANEARRFFLEHEEALRFQMGIERFESKLSLFDKILAN